MQESPRTLDYSADRAALDRHRKHNLDLVKRTKGGHKVRAGLMFAVNRAGDPMGIIGDVYRANAYRQHTWDDEGVSTRSNDPAYDLPFAPSRPAPVPRPAPVYVNFGAALEALHQGRKVTRAIWLGYWYLATAEYRALGGGVEGPAGTTMRQDRVIVAALRDGTFAPAQPYQADLLAEDWIILAN